MWSTALSSGTSSSMSSGSGAVAGRSQASASACARRGQALHLLGVRGVARRREAEEVRRHRRRHVLDAVGRDLRQVSQQALVDLGVDVEDVAELVDPVVEVHGSTVTPHPGESQAPSGELVVTDAVRRRGRGRPPRCPRRGARRRPTARRRGRGGRATAAAPHRAGPRGRAGPRPGPRSPTTSASCLPAVGSHEHGAVAAGRGVPEAPEGRRGEVRHVAGQHREPGPVLQQRVAAGQHRGDRAAVPRVLPGERHRALGRDRVADDDRLAGVHHGVERPAEQRPARGARPRPCRRRRAGPRCRRRAPRR